MSFSEDTLISEDMDPIDLVEVLAEHRAWDFDRVADNQIAMAVEGQWRTYSLTLAWSGRDETLRLVCSFEMSPPKDRLPDLLALVNRVNDECWTGAFSYWADQEMMVWRYGLVLAGGTTASAAQIDRMIASAVMQCERFYPAFQLIGWGNCDQDAAMQIAISEAYGRA
jgi:hypothetical protein